MSQKTIGLAAFTAIAIYLVTGSSDSSKERYFKVNGQSVPESKLSEMGYTKVSGNWWPNSAVQQAAQQRGVIIPVNQPGTNQQGDLVWAIIGSVLATGMQFIPLFQKLGKNKGSNNGGKN